MAKKLDIGEVVASSMREILESESHQLLFSKTAAKKKCCACETKCARKCPCKTDGGCKKSCAPCEALAKKASEDEDKKKKCCDCVSSCGDKCPCAETSEATCSDCASCGDGMMSAKAVLEMVEALLAISEEQDAAGLHASADQSYKSALVLMRELQKKASDLLLDENEVSVLDDFELDEENLSNLDFGSDTHTPALDDALKSDESFKEMMKKDPDFMPQLRRRMLESESVGSEDFDLENILPPSSRDTDLLPMPDMGPTPPSEAELANKVEKDLASGNNLGYLMYDKPMSDHDVDASIGDARSELADKYKNKYNPELFDDEELEAALATDRIDTLVSKFAFDVDSDFEDEGVGLEEMFPTGASDLDTMMDELLQQGDDEASADDMISPEQVASQKIQKLIQVLVGKADLAMENDDLNELAQIRDDVESLFNAVLDCELNEPGDNTMHEKECEELNELHQALVDHLKVCGYENPGSYLSDNVEEEDVISSFLSPSAKNNADMQMVDSYLEAL